MTTLATYVDALESTWSGLASVCAPLSEDEWHLPTDLPGWSVKDNVSHVVGLELLLLGEPYPSHDLPESLPHVRNDAGRFMEVPVDLRRAVPGADVLAELRDVTNRRLAALREVPESALGEPASWFGTRPLTLDRLLSLRVFDCWAHEQDVRRALGRPGGLSSPAARVSLDRILLALESVEPDGGIALTVTGPQEAFVTLGSGAEASVTTDFETLVRLVCGRSPWSALDITVSGDVALAETWLRDAAVTP